VPLLKGETPKDWRKSLYYHYYEYPAVHSVRRHEGVADGRYKLIRYYGLDVPAGEEWELYDLDTDPNEMKSVYDDPEMARKIKALKAELERLKKQYDVPENGGQKIRQHSQRGGRSAKPDKLSFSFKKGAVPNNKAPYIQGRGIEVNVAFSYSGSDGVLVAQGGASEGYALWVKDGIPQWTVKRTDEGTTIAGGNKLSSGKHSLSVVQDKKGMAVLKLDGKEIAKGSVGWSFKMQPHDTLSVGIDSGSPVTDYGKSKRYTGDIDQVEIKLLK
jgi:hypothetical protein